MQLPKPNPWLAETRRLARGVNVDDYIYAPGAAPETRPPPLDLRLRLLVIVSLIAVGALLAQAVLWATGLRIVSSADKRIIAAAYRIDPHPEKWADSELEKRLSARKDVVELFETVGSLPITKDQYPYIAVLSGHPSPLLDPGESPALLLLARSIDAFPLPTRPAIVHSVVSIGVALGNFDLQAAIQVLSRLDPSLTQRLVGNEAAGLKHLFADEIAFQDAAGQRDHLAVQLPSERVALAAEIKALSSAIEIIQTHRLRLSNADRRCNALFAQYRACLNGVAEDAKIR